MFPFIVEQKILEQQLMAVAVANGISDMDLKEIVGTKGRKKRRFDDTFI